MTKIVINTCYGGFSISRKAAEYMAKRGHKRAQAELQKNSKKFYGYGYVDGFDGGYERDDVLLVEAVEKLGKSASEYASKLHVVEIPNGIKWVIHDDDGMESVEEEHRSWS